MNNIMSERCHDGHSRCRAVRLITATLVMLLCNQANAYDFTQCESGRNEAKRLMIMGWKLGADRYRIKLAEIGKCYLAQNVPVTEVDECIGRQEQNKASVEIAKSYAKSYSKGFQDKAFKILQYLEKSGCSVL